MRYWCGYLSGLRCRLFAYSPADAAASQNPLASFKSRLVLLFWYRLIQVVLDKRPLNGCSSSSSSPLAASTETSVQDCMSGMPIDYFKSTDVLICRHSSHTYHSPQQKFCCHRTTHVEQFTCYYKTAMDSLGNIWLRNRST